MKQSVRIAVGVLLTMASVQLAIADDSVVEYSAEAYTSCSACHLPNGVGVPGAFPPINNRAAAIAQLPGGRDYLITVVSYGLMGTIEVSGVQYFGVMAGNAGAMSATDIAQALNYVVFELNDGDAGETESFSAEEVQRVQESVSVKSPTAAGEQRMTLVSEQRDQWP